MLGRPRILSEKLVVGTSTIVGTGTNLNGGRLGCFEALTRI